MLSYVSKPTQRTDFPSKYISFQKYYNNVCVRKGYEHSHFNFIRNIIIIIDSSRQHGPQRCLKFFCLTVCGRSFPGGRKEQKTPFVVQTNKDKNSNDDQPTLKRNNNDRKSSCITMYYCFRFKYLKLFVQGKIRGQKRRYLLIDMSKIGGRNNVVCSTRLMFCFSQDKCVLQLCIRSQRRLLR